MCFLVLEKVINQGWLDKTSLASCIQKANPKTAPLAAVLMVGFFVQPHFSMHKWLSCLLLFVREGLRHSAGNNKICHPIWRQKGFQSFPFIVIYAIGGWKKEEAVKTIIFRFAEADVWATVFEADLIRCVRTFFKQYLIMHAIYLISRSCIWTA